MTLLDICTQKYFITSSILYSSWDQHTLTYQRVSETLVKQVKVQKAQSQPLVKRVKVQQGTVSTFGEMSEGSARHCFNIW